METNTLRIPIWSPVRAVQLALSEIDLGPIHGSECVVKGHAKMPDFRLLVEFVDAYVRAGCPESRVVPFTLGAAARVLGYQEGGRQREAVKDALDRLGSVRIRRTAVRFAGSGKRHEETLGYGLIGQYRITTRGGGRGWVELTEPLAILARLGELTYLHRPTLDTLIAEDEVAARLWSYLEADAGPAKGIWRYSIFAADTRGVARERDMPAIADLLWLRAARRRDTIARIRKACRVIESKDPRYGLKVVKSDQPGMWRLEASRQEVRADDREVRPHDAKGKTARRRKVRADDALSSVPSVSSVESLPSEPSVALREDLDVLAAAWRRAPSKKQVNLIDIIRSQRRMNVEEAAAAFREAIASNIDPIDHLRVRRKPPRPIRTLDDIEEELPPLEGAA